MSTVRSSWSTNECKYRTHPMRTRARDIFEHVRASAANLIIMRVVMVANWWYRRGGLGSVMFAEAQGLKEAGHEVVGFAAAHDENLPSPASRFFPPFVETSTGGSDMSPLTLVRAAAKIVYNRDAARLFAGLLDEVKPDLVHVHNTVRQLSPAVLGPAAKRNIPAVMTAHDFSLVCPQGLLLKGGQSACAAPDCLGGNVLRAVRYRCVKDSVAVSSLAAVENLTHRATGLYYRRLKAIMVPSHFLEGALGRGGVPRRLIRYVPNGLPIGPEPASLPATGGQVLYFGRLAPEKGLDVLLSAARRLPGTSFCIAGDGPLGAALRGAAPENVRFPGHLAPPDLADEIARASVVVSPSICHENAPLSVLEAMRGGRPVVASNLGGHPELVGDAGIVVAPGDSSALARCHREPARGRPTHPPARRACPKALPCQVHVPAAS